MASDPCAGGARCRGLAACLLSVALAAAGCGAGGEDRLLQGRVTAGGKPVSSAKVEVYLEAGRFRASEPFAVAYTDEGGGFELSLPRGSYYLVARTDSGEGERLFGEFPRNPVDLGGAKLVKGVDIPLGAAVSSRDYRGPDDSGVEGEVLLEGSPAPGSHVYVYSGEEEGLMGPGYLTAQPVDSAGRFRVNLAPGRYWLAARRKAGGEKAGFVGPGDLTGTYDGNPVTVVAGRFSGPLRLQLHAADQGRLAEVGRRRSEAGGTAVSGVVLDKHGVPAGGLYVILYDHPQMIGRPVAVAVADAGGRFVLGLASGGRYFLGARQNRSGPRNPGELAGGYEGSPDHSVSVPEGGRLEGLVIRVEEVW